MIYYLDTSVLIPIFIDEPRSGAARNWLRTSFEEVVIADFTTLEFSAVITRAVRTAAIPEPRAEEIFADFDVLRRDCRSYAHCRNDMTLAERLLRDISTKLAAPDALHLASSINLGAALVTFDDRLLGAATLKGAPVHPM